MISIIGDSQRKSRYDPNLAEQFNREVELEEKREALRNKQKGKAEIREEPRIVEPTLVLINSSINPEEYVIIPNTGEIIAINQSHGNLTYEEAHKSLLKEGFRIPTPYGFMNHFMNVIDAYNKKSQLFTASGKPLGKKETKDLYEKLTHDCWVWLNAKFVSEKGRLNLDLETVTGLDPKGTLIKNVVPLESCLADDAYVGLNFNSQGMAQKVYSNQNYEQGKNIKFWYPRERCVARFYADSDGASLSCNWGPVNRNAGLGVFASAQQGAKQSQNFGGKLKI